MNAAQRYANLICDKYGVEPVVLSPGSEGWNIGQIAANILPDGKLQQWLDDEKAFWRSLRAKYGIDPVDKFDSLTLEDLQELRQ